jgi:iron-sulfur cluster assembly accessory protein
MTGSGISVTSRAAKRIHAILSKEASPSMLRVAVEGGGCSGFRYDFRIEQDKSDDDLVLEREGATVLIDPVSVGFLEGCEIDFVDDLIGASFQVKNPNATASCGCGTSFAM